MVRRSRITIPTCRSLRGRTSARRPLEELLDGDVIVLVTAHPGIDYGAVVRDGPLFVDLRGVTRGRVEQGVVTL